MEKQGQRTEIWSAEASDLWWGEVMAEPLVLGSVQLLVMALVEL
jgi:hypothetical protein